MTGLDYYVARYYDPLVGIFLTVDTVQGNLLGFDPYSYVQGNPETMNDPTGHWGWGDTFAAIAAVVVVAAVVTVALVAAPVIVAAGAAVLTGSAVDLGAVATTALGVSITNGAVAISSGGAVAAGLTAGIGAAAGEAKLAYSSWQTGTAVSSQQIWSTALTTGGYSALGGYLGAAAAGYLPGQGCLPALARFAIPKAAAGVGGVTGYAMMHTQHAHAAAVTQQKKEAAKIDQQRNYWRQNYDRNYAAYQNSLRPVNGSFTPLQEAHLHAWRNEYRAVMCRF